MTKQEIRTYVSEIGVDMVESAGLLSVSPPTIRNAIKFPDKLSNKMWKKLADGLRDIGVGQ